jgi:hypothetical protein
MSETKRTIADAEIEAAILALLAEAGPGKSIDPGKAAERVGGAEWRGLLARVRRIAAAMMKRGEVAIIRKGRPVDPDDFRGVVRLRLPQ